MEKHIFALYKEKLSELVEKTKENEVFEFKDAELWNRLTKIVRIKLNDHFVLFDEHVHITLSCAAETLFQKRMIIGTIIEKKANKIIEPPITLYLPILKKEAFEYIAYVAAQMGITKIIPVITQKSEQKLSTSEERLKKICIAACEQSKNFVPPTLCEAISLQNVSNESLIFFTEHGTSLHECIKKIITGKSHSIIIGPEAGFSDDEEKFLKGHALISCALTPTILRSREAAAIGIGIVRSLISNA